MLTTVRTSSMTSPNKGMQRAGYVIDYDSGSTGFKFVTIQGAGHLVPTYKPHFALTMITKFLKNEEF